MSALTIGIVSETLAQQHYLKHSVNDIGYSTECCLLVSELSTEKAIEKLDLVNIDAWVIDVDVDRLGINEEYFQKWIYDLDALIIFSEGNTYNATSPDFFSWTRQLKMKLLHLEGQQVLAQQGTIKAKHVWVLAASTGGPEAVKKFLAAMPINLDLAFVYVQHIGEGHSQILSNSITRSSQYECSVAMHGDIVSANRIFLVPPEHQISVQKNGSIIAYTKKPWRGVYKPSVDQVVANIASIYGELSGVIFFSGMGDDGAKASRLMALHRGQVWAQTITNCVAPSMPQEVINTGCTNKIDSPENLAIHLKCYLMNKHNDNNGAASGDSRQDAYQLVAK